MPSAQQAFLSAVSNRPLLKVLLLVALLIFSFWIASFFPDLVLTLIISFLCAFVLRPLVSVLEFRFGIRRSIAVGSIFLLVGGLLVGAAIIFVPKFIERIGVLYANFKAFPFDQKLNDAATAIAPRIPFTDPDTVARTAHSFVRAGLAGLGDILDSVVRFMANIVIIPFITFFILAEGDLAAKRLIERVPNKYFEMTLNVLYKIQSDLVGYLRGWIMDSVIVGILNIVAFSCIGVDYAIPLGIFAGIANLIPYVGPFFGVVPPLLVSLIQYGDFRQAYLILAVTLVLIQILDNLFIQPFCFSKSVDMHPVTVIVVLIVGNSLLGIAGMLLAIPIATILKASTIETYWGLKNYQITA